MMYADYEFYTSQYRGNVKEPLFSSMVIRASSFLDYYTMGKAKANAGLYELKMACCALVDKYAEIEALSLAAQESLSGGASYGKVSESVGSYSVTYQTPSDFRSQQKELKAELAEIARMYLAGTNLLYRGGCNHVCSPYRNHL